MVTLEVAKKKGQGGDQGAEDEPEQVQDRGGGGWWCREVCHYHPVHSGVIAMFFFPWQSRSLLTCFGELIVKMMTSEWVWIMLMNINHGLLDPLILKWGVLKLGKMKRYILSFSLP